MQAAAVDLHEAVKEVVKAGPEALLTAFQQEIKRDANLVRGCEAVADSITSFVFVSAALHTYCLWPSDGKSYVHDSGAETDLLRSARCVCYMQCAEAVIRAAGTYNIMRKSLQQVRSLLQTVRAQALLRPSCELSMPTGRLCRFLHGNEPGSLFL